MDFIIIFRRKMGLKTEDLKAANPGATWTECERFRVAFGKKQVSRNLRNYLLWRAEHGSQDEDVSFYNDDDDAQCWERAVIRALDCFNQQDEKEESEVSTLSSDPNDRETSISELSQENDAELLSLSNNELFPHDDRNRCRAPRQTRSLEAPKPAIEGFIPVDGTVSLPRFVLMHTNEQTGDFLRDLNGNRVLHVLPAQLDTKIAAEIYALALAVYLEQLFQDRDDDHYYEQVTILLDVRPGAGWPNAPASQMVGLIRHVANQLHLLHPTRLCKCIIFPIPRAAIVFWNAAIKPFLDHKLRKVIELVPGSGANLKSPTPHDKLAKFISQADSVRLERHRLLSFKLNGGFLTG